MNCSASTRARDLFAQNQITRHHYEPRAFAEKEFEPPTTAPTDGFGLDPLASPAVLPPTVPHFLAGASVGADDTRASTGPSGGFFAF